MPTPRKRTAAPRKAALPPELSAEHAQDSADAHRADADVFEFINAIDAYKRSQSRPFPTWTEILAILKRLGYRKPTLD
jgi:hypothetical protein